MKQVQKFVLVILVVLWSTVLCGQNWMMAHKYMISAIDSLIAINWPNTGKLTGLSVEQMEYDDVFDMFTIQFRDTISCSKQDIPLKNGEEPDIVVQYGELLVGLTGGEATYEDGDGELTAIELPDLSDLVFIWNDVGKEISFSLSNDDIAFEAFKLRAYEYYYYPCLGKNFSYVKVFTINNGKETGNVHLKLEKAKGYKVVFSEANSKFEVSPDKRMDVEDFKK